MPEHLRGEALDAVHEASRVHRQLAEGLDFLVGDAEAMRCFGFMNRVMADQRVQTQVAALRAGEPSLSSAGGPRPGAGQGTVGALVVHLPDRVHPHADSRVVPTGPAAPIRRPGQGRAAVLPDRRRQDRGVPRPGGVHVRDPPLQGRSTGADGPLDGGAGVAVLMRYTLRLLTAQQFQRATTLVCAAELARREDPAAWGSEPFRIGLWVGTDVSPKRVDEADKQLRDVNEGHGYRLTVLQIRRCPWCGTPIGSGQVRVDMTARRVFVRCGDDLGSCPFAAGGAVEEGLPVLTVDEEIYRLVPAFVIATVDKFARLAREGEAAALFGYVASEVRSARVRPCGLPRVPAQTGRGAPGQGRLPRGRHPSGDAAAPSGPGHPGRAAPDHRCPRHDRGAVRGRCRRADHVADGRRRRSSSR